MPDNVPLLLPTLGGPFGWADVRVLGPWRLQQSALTGHHRLLGPSDVRLAWGTRDVCEALFERHAPATSRPHLVVLLHGLLGAKNVFEPMSRALYDAGYGVAAVNYPSALRGLADHADQVRGILDATEGVDTVSFVGHSMGGIVARAVTATPGAWRERMKLHRLVTLASPNTGSTLAGRLRNTPGFDVILGPAARDVAPDQVLPEPGCPLGAVIATRGDGRGYNPLIDGDDDGVIAAAEAGWPGAEDTLVVHGIHTMLPLRTDVIAAVVRYLATGRFQGDEPLPADPA